MSIYRLAGKQRVSQQRDVMSVKRDSSVTPKGKKSAPLTPPEKQQVQEWVEMVTKKKKKPSILVPTVWEKPTEEQKTIGFMQECRERTASMKDEEKCNYCKLRFKCFTEIKVEKKERGVITRKIDGTEKIGDVIDTGGYSNWGNVAGVPCQN